jgi:hypothetical protein
MDAIVFSISPDSLAAKEMKRSYVIVATILFAILVIYPLSVGPVLMLNGRYNHGDEPSWSAIYFPLFWACDHSEALTSALQWYVEKWMPLVKGSQ